MGLVKTVVGLGAVAALGAALVIGGLLHYLSLPSPKPNLPVQYWGPGSPKADNTAVVPFKISFSDDALKDLQHRLKSLPPLTPPLENANFRYGFNSEYFKKVVNFWLNDYKWKEREVFLNSLPQFKTQVSGLSIHFIHAKPSAVPAGTKVLPLLLLHGWPGSVREFYELIPLLTTPRQGAGFVFEVVAPSLPGYGFSEGASKQGLGPAQMGVIFRSLMERLGFKKFFVHGGDWGHAVGASMATLFPESVLGFHTNVCFLQTPLASLKLMLWSFYPSLFLDDNEIKRTYPLSDNLMFILEESGYFHLQATKPDTVGVSLRDSPAGLAAYILEKFSTWTNREWRDLPDGGLTKKYTLTNLLDNIMIYWISGSITTSARLYSEANTKKYIALELDNVPCEVPTAFANLPEEILYVPKKVAEDKYKRIVHWSYLPRGGHFAVFEEPKQLADDIWEAMPKLINPPATK